jgi:GNAT superfamily N-acetyltransferase
MSSAVQVRALTDLDLPGAVTLWGEMSPDLKSQPSADQIIATLRTRIAVSTASEAHGAKATFKLIGAHDAEGQLIGLASLTVVEQSLFELSPVVVVEGIHVVSDFRNSGVGRAMLAAAASFAVAVGASEVAVNAPAQSRPVNRFFAKWGFVSTTVHRAISVDDLTRRLLKAGTEVTRDPDSSQLQRLLRRRAVIGARSLRTPRVAR